MRSRKSVNAFSIRDFVAVGNLASSAADSASESESLNSEDYQLVTWSVDRTLRLWPISEDVMRRAGYIPGEKWTFRRGFGDDPDDVGHHVNSKSMLPMDETDITTSTSRSLGEHHIISFTPVVPIRDLPLVEDGLPSGTSVALEHVIRKRARSTGVSLSNRLSMTSSGDRGSSFISRERPPQSLVASDGEVRGNSRVKETLMMFFGDDTVEDITRLSGFRVHVAPQQPIPVFPVMKVLNVDDEVSWCQRIPGVTVEGWVPLGPSPRSAKRKSALRLEDDTSRFNFIDTKPDEMGEQKLSRTCRISIVVPDCFVSSGTQKRTSTATVNIDELTHKKATLPALVVLSVEFPVEYPREPLVIEIRRSPIVPLEGRIELANRLSQIAYVSAYRRIPALEPCLRYLFSTAPFIFRSGYPSIALDLPSDAMNKVTTRRKHVFEELFAKEQMEFGVNPRIVGDFAFGFLPEKDVDWDAPTPPLSIVGDGSMIEAANQLLDVDASTAGVRFEDAPKLPRSVSYKGLEPTTVTPEVKPMPLAQNVPFPRLCGATFAAGTGRLYFFKSPIPHPRDTDFLKRGVDDTDDKPRMQGVSMPRNYPVYEEYRTFLLQNALVALTDVGLGETGALKCDDVTGEVVWQRTFDDVNKIATAEPSWMRGLFPEKTSVSKPQTSIWSGFLEKVRVLQALKNTQSPVGVGTRVTQQSEESPGQLSGSLQAYNPVMAANNSLAPGQRATNSGAADRNGVQRGMRADDESFTGTGQFQALERHVSAGLSSSADSSISAITPKLMPPAFGQTIPVAIPQTDSRAPSRQQNTDSIDHQGPNSTIIYGTVPARESFFTKGRLPTGEGAVLNDQTAGTFESINTFGKPGTTGKSAGLENNAKSSSRSKRGSQASIESMPRITLGTVVRVADLDHLLTVSPSLAAKYVHSGNSPVDVCLRNEAIARVSKRPDLARLWAMATIILTPCVPPSGTTADSSVCAPAFAGIENGPVTAVGQRIRFGKNGDLAVDAMSASSWTWRRVDWRSHPFGRRLVEKLFSQLEKLRDVQTLAILTCVMTEDRRPDLLPKTAVRFSGQAQKTEVVRTNRNEHVRQRNSRHVSGGPSRPALQPDAGYLASLFGLVQKPTPPPELTSSLSHSESTPSGFQTITDGRLASSPHTFVSQGEKVTPTQAHISGVVHPSQSALGLSSIFRYAAGSTRTASSEPVQTERHSQRLGMGTSDSSRLVTISKPSDDNPVVARRSLALPLISPEYAPSKFRAKQHGKPSPAFAFWRMAPEDDFANEEAGGAFFINATKFSSLFGLQLSGLQANP
ncbi:hypothetical protein HDU93_007533 [Gonapodya sp. JEL0774]|nr:hypothetical protein HDU93_007533 [Gonapodya sp. JEL0774]